MMKKLGFTLFLLVSCQGANHQAVNPGNESKSANSVFIDESPVDADSEAVTPVESPKSAAELETIVAPEPEAVESLPEAVATKESAEPAVALPRVLSSVRLCDNANRGYYEPFYFKVRVSTYSNGDTTTEILLRKDIYTLIDTKIEGSPVNGNFYMPMSQDAKLIFGYGQAQPVYTDPLFRIEMFQNEKDKPLLFIFAKNFANGSQYLGVSQPITDMVCTNFKVSE